MKFQRERATPEFIEEVLPLLRLHYKEIAAYQDIPLEPDFTLYLKIEETGGLRVFTAREDGTSQLIGYAVYFIKSNPHYLTSLQASQDIVFMRKEHRGTQGAILKYSEEALKEEGVQVLYHHIKAAHNWGPMLEKMGYHLHDYIYAKRLS